MTLIERCCRYALKVECDRCGGEVYFPDSVQDEVEILFEHNEISDIDDFKDVLERMCDYCVHVTTKDC